jgi:hypothetical protein
MLNVLFGINHPPGLAEEGQIDPIEYHFGENKQNPHLIRHGAMILN